LRKKLWIIAQIRTQNSTNNAVIIGHVASVLILNIKNTIHHPKIAIRIYNKAFLEIQIHALLISNHNNIDQNITKRIEIVWSPVIVSQRIRIHKRIVTTFEALDIGHNTPTSQYCKLFRKLTNGIYPTNHKSIIFKHWVTVYVSHGKINNAIIITGIQNKFLKNTLFAEPTSREIFFQIADEIQNHTIHINQ